MILIFLMIFTQVSSKLMKDKIELAFLHVVFICLLKDNVESKVKPKYLALVTVDYVNNIQRV